MKKFVMDTEVLTDIVGKLNTLSGEVDGITSSITSLNGDISTGGTSDGFDFASAIAAIESNLVLLSEKCSGLSDWINSAIAEHTKIQNDTDLELEPDGSENKGDEEESIVGGNLIYTIKRGDNLSKIAKIYGVTVNDLLIANSYITDPDLIYVGNTLVIPAAGIADNVINDGNNKVPTDNDGNNSPTGTLTGNDVSSDDTGKTVLTGFQYTSFYPSESSNKTGSGKTTEDFDIVEIDGKQVYAYEGKLVVAAATEEYLKVCQDIGRETICNGYFKDVNVRQDDKHYFNYGDTLTVTINGKDYEAIVLDSCGAAMGRGEHRIDFFVADSPNSSGKNPNMINAYDGVVKI